MADCIVFTGGGTGGHVFPALAVLEELGRRWPGRLVWIGSAGGIEGKILNRSGIDYYSIPAGKLRRYFSLRNLLDLFKIAGGLFLSLLILLKERPRLVFSKGGYVSVPPVAAAAILGIPVYTHESDLDPGLATRINSMFAERILTSFRPTGDRFGTRIRPKVIHTGNPIRPDLLRGQPRRGKELVGCPPELSLILVLGGSQGSSFLNRLILSGLGRLSQRCFVVHQMGSALYRQTSQKNYFAAPFFGEELPHILAAATLIICRSGANTLWELAAVGKPSILVPLGKGSSRGDQIGNSRFFEKEGAAVVLVEEEASSARLVEIVLNLLDNKEKLQRMGAKALALGRPESAVRIAELLLERIERSRRKGSGYRIRRH